MAEQRTETNNVAADTVRHFHTQRNEFGFKVFDFVLCSEGS